jgi:hypothetical protein
MYRGCVPYAAMALSSPELWRFNRRRKRPFGNTADTLKDEVAKQMPDAGKLKR